MATVPLIAEEAAPAEVKAVYDDIKSRRGVDRINNFWKALANDPANLARFWEDMQRVMGKGALDPLVKELIYVAVSITNNCEYCIHSHTAAARQRGLTDEQYREFLAVIGLAARWHPALSLAVPNRRLILNSSPVAGRPTQFP